MTATSRRGDGQLRALLYEAAAVLMTRVRRESALRSWGLVLWKRLGFKHAATALARKMAMVLHADVEVRHTIQSHSRRRHAIVEQ